MGVRGWAGDAENPEEAGGGGKEEANQEGASSFAVREEAIKWRALRSHRHRGGVSSAAPHRARAARLPQSPPHGHRHTPSPNAIMPLMFQLPDDRARVCFHFIPVPGTVSGT